jgi:molecular chaperone GrpE
MAATNKQGETQKPMSDVESVSANTPEQETDDHIDFADAVAPDSAADEEPKHSEREEETTAQAEELAFPEEVEYEVIEEGPAKDELEALQAELEQVQAQAAEYLDGWQRARAEFANYKKRVEAERVELRRSSTEALLLKLLPVIDDFERAFQALPEDSTEAVWVDGLAMILRKLQAILESQDVTPIEAAGQPFDPLWHEAVMQEETDEHPDGYVTEEMQRGYRLGDRVLRPSMVKVASNTNESGDE